MSDGGPSCGARSSRPLTATLQRVGPAVVSGAACHPRGMARTWLSVTVELLGGRGEELWPWPGRIFAVGPSHTFMDLANAIKRCLRLMGPLTLVNVPPGRRPG